MVKKNKTKIIYRNIKPKEDEDKKLKEEIAEYTSKRNQVKETGIRGFFARAQYNRAINERNSIIRDKIQLRNLRLKNELEAEKIKLMESRKKSSINLEGLNNQNKKVSFGDIFG